MTCEPLASIGAPGDSITVVTTGGVRPPGTTTDQNAGDRFVAKRAYETLVSVDCGGRVLPGLAGTWVNRVGNEFSFTVRGHARFWNGDRVTAGAIVAAWTASTDSLPRMLADSSTVVGDTELVVRLAPSSLRLLASPRAVVARPLAGSAWPEGTGTHRVLPGEVIRLHPTSDRASASFTIRSATPAAARNFIDDGIDLLLTGDSATAAYAARRMATAPIALEWDRTWVLITPLANAAIPDSRLERLREDLAAGAVRSNARAAVAPAWTNVPAECFSRRQSPTRSRIAYSSDQPVARALAERLVAVASLPESDSSSFPVFGTTQNVTAVSLSREVYDVVLRTGTEAGAIASISYRSERTCTDVRAIPLVDTRWQAVLRVGIRRDP